MAQDPWRRAYQLSRQKQAGDAPQPGLDPARKPPRAPGFPWLRIVLLLLAFLGLGGLGAWAWLSRERWVPQVREKLPEPVKEAVPAPRVRVDRTALEDGLGIRLAVFGDYDELLAATREWKVDWRLTAMGPGRVRLEAPGVKAYAGPGGIESYIVNVPQVLITPCWKRWLPVLRKAGLSPELSWQALTGEQEPPSGAREYQYANSKAVQLGSEWARQAFVLRFEGGVLVRLEGRTNYGPYRPPGELKPLQPEVVEPMATPHDTGGPQQPAPAAPGK
jgi:hypothetical protein